jgi:DNA-binding YbaB/EbfC family protein
MNNFNMADMFGKIQEMQEKVKESQAKLEHIQVHAEVGGGMVKVTANGHRKVLKIEVDESLVGETDREMLEDLVVAGVNRALEKAEEAAQEEMQSAYKGMMPGGGIPGFDLSKFGL